MDALIQTADIMISWMKMFYDSFLTDWGILGMAIISFFVVPRVVNFIKRMFL